ncbi:MBL fold metallo-hydrolase [Microbacterium sediminicola]|uniref:MBL fold metallo-hydrolase n=1 Tax=Microbacterium sediminicola TaxID=415210 RepID=A0ABP4TST3_9MICO
MRVTKHEHAALTLRDSGKTLIIDPGSFTDPILDAGDIIAVVVTHEHADHWTPEHLRRILSRAPMARIFAPQGVADAAADFEIRVVTPGERVEIGPFTLEFFGGLHEVIHSSLPVVQNVGVLVNDGFYYAGDSYDLPTGHPVKLLAAPAGAPWLKLGDAMDFILAIAPRLAFATHDMTLSTIGRRMARQRLTWATEQGGGEFLVLDPGMSIDI